MLALPPTVAPDFVFLVLDVATICLACACPFDLGARAAEAKRKEAKTLAKLKAQKAAGNVSTEAEIRRARDRGQTTTGQTLSKTQSQKSTSEKMADRARSQRTIEARTKSGQFDSRGLARGGRAKGGLMKKPNKK